MTARKDQGSGGSEFFSPENLFRIMVGKDGRGGAIGQLENKLSETNKNVTGLEGAIRELEGNLRQYNGLHGRLDGLEGVLQDQIDNCKEIQTGKATAEAVTEAYTDGLQAAEKKGEKNAERKFNRAMMVWGKILGTITVAIAAITFFLGLWSF